MQTRTAPAWILYLASALVPSIVAAQPPGSLVSPRSASLLAEEPRPFPPAGTIDARPLGSAYQPATNGYGGPASPLSRTQPPANVRLVTAEGPAPTHKAKPPLRLAPRSEASRQPTKKSATPTPSSALTTVAGSLTAVLGLFIVVVWFARRFTPGGTTQLPKEAVELLGRASLTARQQAQLVRVGNKLLLVAISPVGVETLTEITEPTEVEHLTALCRRGQSSSSTTAFRQALTQLGSEPAPRGFLGASRPTARGAQ